MPASAQDAAHAGTSWRACQSTARAFRIVPRSFHAETTRCSRARDTRRYVCGTIYRIPAPIQPPGPVAPWWCFCVVCFFWDARPAARGHEATLPTISSYPTLFITYITYITYIPL